VFQLDLLGSFVKHIVVAWMLFGALLAPGVQTVASLFNSNAIYSVVGPLAVIAIAGFFTIRSNVAKIWRENYEAEVAKNALLAQEVKEQREWKHTALNELAALRLELAAERSKPDYGALAVAIEHLSNKIDTFVLKNPDGHAND